MMNLFDQTFFIETQTNAGPTIRNAADDLREYLIRREGMSSSGIRSGAVCVTLGTADSETVCSILGRKPLEVKDGRRSRRAVRLPGGDIVICGSDERAVLDGVFALEEWMMRGQLPTVMDRTWTDAFSFRKGSFYGGEPNQTIGRDEYRTLARTGCTHYTANMAGGVNDHTSLFKLVIPRHIPVSYDRDEIEEYQKATNARIQSMKAWGIKPVFYVFEPSGPDLLGPDIPEEIMGRRYVYWKSRMDRTLCVNHPLVRQYYRDLVHDMIRVYPDVEFLGFYCDDGSYWFCDPALCARCAEHGRTLDYRFNHSVESHTAFLNMLQEAAREVNPAFTVGMATLHLEAQIAEDPRRFISLITPGANIDHNPHYGDGFLYEMPSAEEWKTWEELSSASRQRGISMLAWDEYTVTESLHGVKTLPTVHAAARKLEEYAKRGVEGLYGGGRPNPAIFNPANITYRLMATGEIDDARTAVEETVLRSYGAKAAPLMSRALEELDAGLLALNRDDLVVDLYIRFILALNLDRQMKIPVIPGAIQAALRESFFVYPSNGTRETGPRHFLPEVLKRAQSALPFLERAIEYARQASQAVGLEDPGASATAAALDHPELADYTAPGLVRETLHGMKLWTALYRVWVHRMEAVWLVHMLNVYNDFQPPWHVEYRRTGERFVRLAEEDCANLETLAALAAATPDKREVIKFNAHAGKRVSNADVVHIAEETLLKTREFLADPWQEIHTFWIS